MCGREIEASEIEAYLGSCTVTAVAAVAAVALSDAGYVTSYDIV